MKWGTYPWFEEHGVELIYPDDIEDFRKEANNCKIFMCIEEGEYLTLKYNNKKTRRYFESELIDLSEHMNNFEEKILETVKKEEKIEVVEIFRYGDKKIEFMLLYNDFMISVSVVGNKSYDFTVFDSTGNSIVYNNTQFNLAPDDLCDVLLKDMRHLKREHKL